ncbi:Phenylalanyl-tRNA synthetase beta chain [Candidatus Rhodobacter oscarellae]|uniref:Phenylalanine--tRNA ligase beta subunit n=1 Tax=Candidatus Rhodobacter oscarellae TaxID=1675527 RepID=A0A0J9H3R8_9RHOB|nr:phenylalanine--tRNA ligase subunit beta [Candidatus Rhodobacter lobularis]KMW60323.1 Phenylalanyl-tRNA synthetase beta chain [Candidatus Rhodobacter lobularis]
MKFTLSWLKDHLDTDASVAEIADTLTDLGLEVEEVVDPADALGAFTVGFVKEAEQHPDADRLRVCQVETDEGVKQIICGAPNARAGIRVVVAKPGMYIPGIDTTIQVGKIRGVESHGMMCSEREMELSEEHDGIIELPGEPAVGTKFTDWLAEHDAGKVDPMIEIAITPNRQDALGVRGVARDLAARGLGTLKPQVIAPVPGAFASPIGVRIDAALKDKGCPHFTGRVIRGVKNGPSPAWLQARLKAIGLRPISALVDITNFFTYDQNRPLHVFDADVVQGDLVIRPVDEVTEYAGLDDKTYAVEPGMMGIYDDAGLESLAGILGGTHSGCTEQTVNVFLESAYWDPVTIAGTARKLKVNSDAKYRFERGVDPEHTLPGLEAATQMILELCGGEASEVVQDGAPLDVARAYKLDTDRVASLVGMEIPAETQRATLEALGFTLEGDMAHPPSWRGDVKGEADLVEEVARIASLTKLEGKPMARTQPGVPRPILTPGQKREAIARRSCAALGYNECVTYSFIDAASAARFGGGQETTRLENPISSEMSHMRPSLLPGLLQAAARNQARGFMDLALFEVGAVYHGAEPEDQEALITGILVGHGGARDRFGARRAVDIFDAKADAEAVLAALGAPAKLMHLREVNDWWHPGRSAKLSLGPKNVLGAFGELHPKVTQAYGLKGNVVAFAIHPAKIPFPKAKGPTRAALQLHDLQAVERDFAFVVDAGVEAGALVNAAAGADKALIAEVRVFDEFIGGSLGEGKKSLAIAVRLQPSDKTLTDEEIEAVGAKIVAKVEKATGGSLRG